MSESGKVIKGRIDRVSEILKKGTRKNNYTKYRWLQIDGKELAELEVLIDLLQSKITI